MRIPTSFAVLSVLLPFIPAVYSSVDTLHARHANNLRRSDLFLLNARNSPRDLGLSVDTPVINANAALPNPGELFWSSHFFIIIFSSLWRGRDRSMLRRESQDNALTTLSLCLSG